MPTTRRRSTPRSDRQGALLRLSLASLYQDEADTPGGRLRARRRLLVAEMGWDARQLPLNRLRFLAGWSDDELIGVVLILRRYRYRQLSLDDVQDLAVLALVGGLNDDLADLDVS